MPELVKNVHAGGEWWGPDYNRTRPPADVAEQITNPACWGDALEKDTDRTDVGTVTDPAVVPDGNVDEVLAWVHGGDQGDTPADGWQERALLALDAEKAGKDRKSVVEVLTDALEKDTEAS